MFQIKRVCKMKKASAEMSANRPLRATSLQVGAQAASTSVAGRATTPVKEATLRRVQGRVSRCRAVRRGSGGPIGARDGIATLVVVSWRYGRGEIKHERKRNGGRTAAPEKFVEFCAKIYSDLSESETLFAAPCAIYNTSNVQYIGTIGGVRGARCAVNYTSSRASTSTSHY